MWWRSIRVSALGRLPAWARESVRYLVLPSRTTSPLVGIGDCHQLKILDLSSSLVDVHDLHGIGKQCKRLSMLNIANCPNVNGRLLPFGSEELRTLSFSGCKVDNIDAITDSSPNLRVLDAGGCPIKTIAFGKLYNLQSLNLANNHFIGDASLGEIAAHCARLEYIGLSNCTAITSNGLQGLIESVRARLRALNVEGCMNVDDGALQPLGQGCPKLQALNVSGCYLVTDDAMQAIAAGAPCLQHLNLGRCRRITNAGIGAVASKCSETIEELNLASCGGITSLMPTYCLFPRLSYFVFAWTSVPIVTIDLHANKLKRGCVIVIDGFPPFPAPNWRQAME
jgi:hypothetical protein